VIGGQAEEHDVDLGEGLAHHVVESLAQQRARAVVGDLVFFSCIGILAMFGMLHRSSVSVDAALLAAILGILATIALARIMTRGRR